MVVGQGDHDHDRVGAVGDALVGEGAGLGGAVLVQAGAVGGALRVHGLGGHDLAHLVGVGLAVVVEVVLERGEGLGGLAGRGRGGALGGGRLGVGHVGQGEGELLALGPRGGAEGLGDGQDGLAGGVVGLFARIPKDSV